MKRKLSLKRIGWTRVAFKSKRTHGWARHSVEEEIYFSKKPLREYQEQTKDWTVIVPVYIDLSDISKEKGAKKK